MQATHGQALGDKAEDSHQGSSQGGPLPPGSPPQGQSLHAQLRSAQAQLQPPRWPRSRSTFCATGLRLGPPAGNRGWSVLSGERTGGLQIVCSRGYLHHHSREGDRGSHTRAGRRSHAKSHPRCRAGKRLSVWQPHTQRQEEAARRHREHGQNKNSTNLKNKKLSRLWR